MKHCKRILATLLSMAMLFTMAATPVYAAPESTGDSIYKDVSSSEGYYPGLVIQNKLGIFVGDDNGNFNPEATITRAEAAAVVVRMKGLTNAISSSQSTNFSDVPSSHWASGYIATANSMGIVEGYGNGLFGPEDPVKYEEILTMIIRAMGYDPMVNSRGSAWPGNYVSVASSIGVKSTEGGSVGREAPRKVVASLVYSALKAPLMEVVSWGSQTEYAIMDGKGDRDLETLLSENFDAYVIKALVDTTDKASLSSSSKAQEDCAELEILDGYDVEYFEELKDDEELLEVYDNGMLRNHLGAVITAFVREDDNNGAEYELLGDWLAIGALYTARFAKPETLSELTFSANIRPKNNFNLAVSYSVLQAAGKTFGVAAKLGPLFVGTDYMFLGKNTKNVNAYVGISIPLAKQKIKKN